MDKKALTNKRSSVRNALRSQRHKSEELQRQNAARILKNAQVSNTKTTRQERLSQSLLHTTAYLSNRVLHAFGVSVPIVINAGYTRSGDLVEAYTDYRSITVRVLTERIQVNDIDSIVNYINMVKGAVFHEGGHCLFTVPYGDIIMKVRSTPDGDAEFMSQTNQHGAGTLQRAWNILEDQDMESSMVYTSPVLYKYFTSVVLNVVIAADPSKSWPFVTGRLYLPTDIRRELRRLARQHPRADLLPAIDACVRAYRKTSSDSYTERFRLICEFATLLKEWGDNGTGGGSGGGHAVRRDGTIPTPKPVYEDKEEDLDDDPQPTPVNETPTPDEGTPTPSDDKPDTPDDKPDTPDTPDQPVDTPPTPAPTPSPTPNDDKGKPESNDTQHDNRPTEPTPGNGSDTNDPTERLKDLINDELDRIKEESQREAMDFVSRVNEEINRDLMHDPTVSDMPAQDVAEAATIRRGIIGALDHLIDNTSPSWRFRQEHGVIDATSFIMREPGDTDYWSGLDDAGEQGYDLSVSVVLDTSVSMGMHVKRLGIVALAIRQACDYLDIPCSVSTFNTQYGALYRADEPTVPRSIRANGGTVPAPILDMLDNQRFDKKRHLVVILTDGEWSECDSLQPWSCPGRYFLLVGLQMSDDILKKKHADAIFTIWHLNELAGHFTRALAGFLA